jgi:hypothetical protein
MIRTTRLLACIIGALALLHFGIGGKAALADDRAVVADIVTQMNKAEEKWKPILKQLEEQRGGTPERKAAVLQTAKRVREILALSVTIKREAERFLRGDTSDEKIALLNRYHDKWEIKSKELDEALDRLSETNKR